MLFWKNSSEAAKNSSEPAAVVETRSQKKTAKVKVEEPAKVETVEGKKSEYFEEKRDDQVWQRTQDRIRMLEEFKKENIGKNTHSWSVNPKISCQNRQSSYLGDKQSGNKTDKIRRVSMFPFGNREKAAEEIKKKRVHKKKKLKKELVVQGEKFLLYDRYRVTGKMLGKGAYGCVCEAFDTRTQMEVAIKKNKGVFNELEDAKRILREIKLMSHFDHPDIVSLVGVIAVEEDEIETFQDAYLVMELMQVNLAKVIQKQKLQTIHYKFFLYQMLRGLKYIHSAGVIHRDLKPENILVNGENCNLKITDFGLSRGVCKDEAKTDLLTEYVVTRWYRAPEIMCSKKMYDEAVDVWSVGCIFAEFFLRKPLFPGRSHLDQLKIIFLIRGTPNIDSLDWVQDPEAKRWIEQRKPNKGQELSKLLPKVDPNAQDLLSKLLLIDPTMRIEVEDALEHPYLKELHDPTPQTKAKMEKNGMIIGRETETTCPVFNISFEYERAINSKFGIRHMMYKELRDFNKKAAKRLKKNRRAKKKAARASYESKTE